MEALFNRESATFYERAGNFSGQALVTDTFDAENGGRDILDASAQVFLGGVEALDGRIMADGRIKFTAVLGAGASASSVSYYSNFSDYISQDMAQPGQGAVGSASVERVEARMMGSRIEFKAWVGIEGYTFKAGSIELDADTSGLELETLYTEADIPRLEWDVQGRGLNRQILELQDDMPAIKEILFCEALAKPGCTVEQGDKGSILKGTATIRTLYAPEGEEAKLEFISSEIPFSMEMDKSIPGDLKLETHVWLEDCFYEVREDINNERRAISVELPMRARVLGYDTQKVRVISDAYGLDIGVSVEYAAYSFAAVDTMGVGEFTAGGSISFASRPDIREIVMARALPSIEEMEPYQDVIRAAGLVNLQLLYYTPAYELASLSQQIPFEAEIKANGMEMERMLSGEVELDELSFVPQSDQQTLNVTCTMKLHFTSLLQRDVQVVKGVSRSADPLPPNGIHVRFPQAGDTLWSVAKEFAVSIKRLKAANGITEDQLPAGKPLVILRLGS